MENKIIKASAGTGKTYRLSLEYIGLLLKYHNYELSFQEILVITFTKKATSEIRERIFAHLQAIVEDSEAGKELCRNLETSLGISVTPETRLVLQNYYHDMLLNKNLVKIITIDSFINEIFKTIISPYLGITDNTIDNNIPSQVYAEIFKALLEDKKNSDVFNSFFQRSTKKKITDYEHFIRSLLDKRWIFDFIDKSAPGMSDAQNNELAQKCLDEYRTATLSMLQKFQRRVIADYPDMSVADMFKNDFFGSYIKKNPVIQVQDLAEKLLALLTSENLHKSNKDILNADTFWNGGKLFKRNNNKDFAAELKEDYANSKKPLADYIFYSQLLPEAAEIRTIADLVYKKYDEIKFRDKVFTHNDISYYSFHYLYDPELSLIDENFVTNAFYEYLSTSIRFILIDEFQDTGMIQFKILLPIINEVTSGFGTKEYGGVIIVGDEKQSIYGWRGGERDLLLKMPSLLPDNRELSLDTSYRSAPLLIDFINNIFTNPLLGKRLAPLDWPYEMIKAHKKDANACLRVQVKNFYIPRDSENSIGNTQEQFRDFVFNTLLPMIQQKTLDVHKTAILARKNNDLKNIAAVLDELGIDYILESSGSVVSHRAIKPLFYLFNFIVYRDLAYLLKFFRSDLVLMPPEELKQILEFHRQNRANHYTLDELLALLDNIPAVKKLRNFLDSPFQDNVEPAGIDQIDPLILVNKIIQEYNVPALFSQENDLININLFLEIVAEMLVANRDYPKTLKGLLDYCEENAANERFQQLGLDKVDAITLLTIHKSKGLEFDTVFLYWDISSRSSGSYDDINVHLQYRDDFTGLQDYVLNFNYEHIMPWCNKSTLKTATENREAIEELNNIYVALTRAKYNLFMFFAFKKKDGLDKLFDELQNNEQADIDQCIMFSILDIFTRQNALQTKTNDERYGLIGKPVRLSEPVDTPIQYDYSFIKKYIDLQQTKTSTALADAVKKNEYLDYTSVYIKSRDIDKGNVIHYFLSFIRYGTEQEIALAEVKTKNYFGNLLPVTELEQLFTRVKNFINNNRLLLFSDQWQQIFTEITLFDNNGEQYRLDRMMVDKKNKEILIIDYKTGEHQEQQMDEYIRLVKNLPIVRQESYKVLGKFVEIPLY